PGPGSTAADRSILLSQARPGSGQPGDAASQHGLLPERHALRARRGSLQPGLNAGSYRGSLVKTPVRHEVVLHHGFPEVSALGVGAAEARAADAGAGERAVAQIGAVEVSGGDGGAGEARPHAVGAYEAGIV